MAEKLNKTCIICGHKYSYCPSCSKDKNKPTWYAIFDGQNCFDIYEICTAYRDGNIDKKAAYEKIMKCDISELDDFAESTKAQIKDILSYKAENTKTVAKDVKAETNVEPKNDFANKKK